MVLLDSKALERLLDPKLEARQQALAEITTILKNNILFGAQRRNNPLADNELSVVNLVDLTKQLIRWFQFSPVTNQNEVFDLLILIFSRKDFLRHITQNISIQRLKKELVKIKNRLIPQDSAERLDTIDGLLADYENELLVDVGIEVESFQGIEQPKTETEEKRTSFENFLDRFNNVRVSSTGSVSSACDEDEEQEEEFNEFWINLEGGDLEIFNSIDAELVFYGEEERLQTILNFIRATITDFPPEFYLQPPNILETLIEIMPKTQQRQGMEIIRIINFIINGLKDRDVEARKHCASYIPTKKHMNQILRMLTIFFEAFHDRFDPTKVYQHQEILNAIYLVLFDVAEFIKQTKNVCDIYLNEMMNMIAKVIKDFRGAYMSAGDNAMVYRLNYIIGVYVINALVSVIDTESITNYCVNNAWEYECDLALLDWPLKTRTQVYSLLMRNRHETIADDNDMKMLLYDIKKAWNPVANVFKHWNTMIDEDVITNGYACIDIMRIHKSTELITILFEAIEKCSFKFHTHENLKKMAEKMVLRMISCEVLEIRQQAYQLARDCVQKKLSEDQEEKLKEKDLCFVFGIPVTAEIVTQILCFGYTDADENIHKNSKLILFAFLRAKIVYPNHWHAVLEVIKPILPLFAGLFKNDYNLGFFAFDIFHEYAGFNKHELSCAFARFMFCNHPKAREMAKIKLLESLGEDSEYTSELIDMIPENFCIISREKVKDLELLNRNIGYEEEVYENIKDVLKSYKHDDLSIIKTVLVQLNSLMNSQKLTQKSHDDNLWLYFMLTLDMGFPKDTDVRRLVINILYKWAVTVTSFRIYLANEPAVLKFLIKTLVYCQDDFATKRLTSTLLFLLVFCDFIVITDSSVSLPQFIGTLECPFKYQEHWDKSPFNEVSQLELLYEALKEDGEHKEVQEQTMRFMRFTFAEVWFNNCKDIFQDEITHERYYVDCGKKTLKVPRELMLTAKDNKLLSDTSIEQIVRHACHQLESAKKLSQVCRTNQNVIAILMLSTEQASKIAEKLEANVKKLIECSEKRNESQKMIIIEYLELYASIIPWLSDKFIADAVGQKTFFEIFNKRASYDQDVYEKVVHLINSFVETCKNRSNLAEMISYSVTINHKLHFSSNVVEKLIEHLTEVVLKDKQWSDISKIPSMRIIFALINNVLQTFPILLDEKYVNTIFRQLVHATRNFLKSKSKGKPSFLNSNAINQMFAIIETITSLNYKFKLNHDVYSTLYLWLTESERTSKAVLWSIVANLTNKKDDFQEFCKGFGNCLNIPLSDVITKTIHDLSMNNAHEHKAVALVIANFIDHSGSEHLSASSDAQNPQVALAKQFLKQKHICNDALAVIVKKMAQNNLKDVVCIAKRRKLIEKFLFDGVNLDVVLACYKYEDLREHTCDTVSKINEEHLVSLISFMSHSIRDQTKVSESKKFNRDVLNLMLVLLSSAEGVDKFLKILRYTTIIEDLTLVLFEGLHISKGFSEIIFHLNLLNVLLSSCSTQGNKTNVFGDWSQFKICESKYFSKIVETVQSNRSVRSHTIYEKNIQSVVYPIDLLFLQALHVFNVCDAMKITAENKHMLRGSSFLFIKTALENYAHVKTFAAQINVVTCVIEKLLAFTATIQGNPHTEMTKKNGVQHCQQIIKKFCLLLKALTEWSIPVQMSEIGANLKTLFNSILIVHNWISSETVLTNCFLNFLQLLSRTKEGRVCIMQEVNGTALIKNLLKQSQAISAKSPHTPASLTILRNTLKTIQAYNCMADVRVILKTVKIFQVLDVLYPQLQNKKTSWNDVILIWLQFFETFSRYDDSECTPGQISLLCRFVRNGGSQMKAHALKTIRNFSHKSSIGFVVLMSEEFMETIDVVLSETEAFAEKIIVLQTLLNLITKSTQSVSKLKNSSLNRKLKDHISHIEEIFESPDVTINAVEGNQVYGLATMLKNVLYT